MKKIILFISISLSSLGGFAQYNYVPNFDFNIGTGTPRCLYLFCPGSPQKMEDDISYWYSALHNPNCLEWCISHSNGAGLTTCPTPDWMDKNLCSSVREPYTNSDRFAGTYVGTYSKYYEGIRVQLVDKLQSGKVYILKVKLAPDTLDIGKDLQLDFHMTKWTERWNSKKKGNTRMRDIANSNLSANPFAWGEYHCTFMVPQSKHGVMDNLVLVRRSTTGGRETYIYIDQVELYEYCAPNLAIQKRTFDMIGEYPYTGDVIRAGENFLNWWPQGPVKVVDTMAEARFKAGTKVNLLPGFQVKRGGKFHGWIAPCSLPCPFPLADGGPDTVVCGNNCIQIGGTATYGMTYEWTSIPENATAYLTATTVSNPIFCPPEGMGRFRYFVKATNQCGQHWTDEVIVDFDVNPNPVPDFTMTNLSLSDTLSFNLNVDQHTETIKVEILDCSNPANVLRTYEYDRDDDFTCCNFHYKIDRYYNPCFCYKVRVSTKNFCYENWKDTVFDWTRNTTYAFISFSNYICKNKIDDLDGWLWVIANGAKWYSVEVKDRWNKTMTSYSSGWINDTMAMWHPPDNVSAGTYYVFLDIYDCNNIKHSYEYTIYIASSCSSKRGPLGEPNSIAIPDVTKKFMVYPNPASTSLEISGIVTETHDVEISVFDIMGNLRYRTNPPIIQLNALYHEIDVSTFANGFYFVQIRNTTTVETHRISVIR